jgi:hypothetical protein
MKTTIQNTIIGVFTLIGVFTIISGFTENNTTQQTPVYGTPESHVWELVMDGSTSEGRAYLYNKITGEVRKYSRTYPNIKGVKEEMSYIVMKDASDFN